MGEYASRLLKDWRVQLESITTSPIVLCPPSTSTNSTTGMAILFRACLTGLQGLWSPLGWEPAEATAGAAAEVTVARATSSRHSRDGADVGAAANTEPVTDLEFLNGGGRCRRHEDWGATGAEGVGEGNGCAPPEKFF